MFGRCSLQKASMLLQVDAHYKEIMSRAVQDTKAMVVLSQPGMLEKLLQSQSLLENIQKGLNEYLEKKRIYFPRCVYGRAAKLLCSFFDLSHQ